MSWSQRGHDIYIIFSRNSSLVDLSQFDVALTDRSCTVSAPGLEKHGWNFYLEVEAKDAQRIQNTERLMIVVPKKDPTLFWHDLKKQTEVSEVKESYSMPMSNDEPPPEKIRHQSKDVDCTIKTTLPSSMVKECDEDEAIDVTDVPGSSPVKEVSNRELTHENLCHHLKSIKSSWHELGSDIVVYTIFVPHLDPWGTNVSYSDERIQISFKTADDQFHKEHATLPEVMFIWKVNLSKKIIPTKCTHKVTLKLMEIRLLKKEPGSWNGLFCLKDTEEPKESDNFSIEDHHSSGDNRSLPEDGAVGSFPRSHSVSSKTSSTSSRDSGCSLNEPSTSKYYRNTTAQPGYTGLDNIGNTCFMNSVVQALANTRELRDFFLDNRFEADINRTNPLGMRGKMAEAVAYMMWKLWRDAPHSFPPVKFRQLVGEQEARFVDYMQHDAQEFMAFLLDKLHEDLNRIENKPCYEMPEVGDRYDRVVAEESWRLHTSRNNSFIVDLFHGMFKSRLYCPVCKNNSVKFDPFLFLSVPLPKATRVLTVYFFPKDFDSLPVKLTVNVSKSYGKAVEILNQISSLYQCSVHSLRMFEVYRNRIHRFFVPDSSLDKVLSSDNIFVQETLSAKETNEAVYEIAVLQQRTFPDMPAECAHCKISSPGIKIRRCTKCLRIGYCNQECQKADWPQHRKVCERKPEMVGYPFIASVPQSLATSKYLHRLLWRQATKWTAVQYFNLDDKNGSPDVYSLFYIAALNWNGSFKEDLPNLRDFGDEILDLSEYKLLSISWETDTRLSCFVKVATKALEYKVDNRSSSSGSIDLYNCIRLFTEPEILAPQEAWYCPTCKEHVEATKEMSLWQLPDVLLVQLKRFSFKNYMWRDKLDLFVDFPVNGLDMSRYCVHSALSEPLIYDLFAVVNHYGGIYGGHYTTFVRLPSTDDTTKSTVGWRVCDDSDVMKISSEHVVTKNAYVMFYRKRKITESTSDKISVDHLITKSKETGKKNIGHARLENERDQPSSSNQDRASSSGSSSSSIHLPKSAKSMKPSQQESNIQTSSFLDPEEEEQDKQVDLKVRITRGSFNLSDFSDEAGSPEIEKAHSRRMAVCDARIDQDMSMGHIVEEPLLKYDDIFPEEDRMSISDEFNNPPGTSTAVSAPLSSPTQESGSPMYCSILTNEDPPYTDMDAID